MGYPWKTIIGLSIFSIIFIIFCATADINKQASASEVFTRKPIKISIVKDDLLNNNVYTLTNNGEIWEFKERFNTWERLPNIPQN